MRPGNRPTLAFGVAPVLPAQVKVFAAAGVVSSWPAACHFRGPQGIRNLGPSDPKIQFYRTIKEIEQRLGDPAARLQSFIVSNTPSTTMGRQWGLKRARCKSGTSFFRRRTVTSGNAERVADGERRLCSGELGLGGFHTRLFGVH